MEVGNVKSVKDVEDGDLSVFTYEENTPLAFSFVP